MSDWFPIILWFAVFTAPVAWHIFTVTRKPKDEWMHYDPRDRWKTPEKPYERFTDRK